MVCARLRQRLQLSHTALAWQHRAGRQPAHGCAQPSAGTDDDRGYGAGQPRHVAIPLPRERPHARRHERTLSSRSLGFRMAIRHVAALVFGLVLAALAAAAAPASATTILRASADKIAFYFDRFTIKADGNVRLSLDATTDVAAQTLIIDLRSTRLIGVRRVPLGPGSLADRGTARTTDSTDTHAYF